MAIQRIVKARKASPNRALGTVRITRRRSDRGRPIQTSVSPASNAGRIDIAASSGRSSVPKSPMVRRPTLTLLADDPKQPESPEPTPRSLLEHLVGLAQVFDASVGLDLEDEVLGADQLGDGGLAAQDVEDVGVLRGLVQDVSVDAARHLLVPVLRR